MFNIALDLAVTAAAVAWWQFATDQLSAVCFFLLFAAGVAGYKERNVMRVWVHGLVMASPAILWCTYILGFSDPRQNLGYGVAVVGIYVATAFCLLLVAVSYATYFIKRRFGP